MSEYDPAGLLKVILFLAEAFLGGAIVYVVWLLGVAIQ